MGYLAAFGGVASLALALVVWALKIRINGLHGSIRAAKNDAAVAAAALKVGNSEFADYRLRAEAKEATLIEELRRFEERELDAIEEEPDRDTRIRRRREWVRGVLSQAPTSTGDNGQDRVPKDPAS